MEELQLHDLCEGDFRYVVTCPHCQYRASLLLVKKAPTGVKARNRGVLVLTRDNRYWTVRDIARHLRCSSCKKRLLAGLSGEPSKAMLSRLLSRERVTRSVIAFQGGLLFSDSEGG